MIEIDCVCAPLPGRRKSKVARRRMVVLLPYDNPVLVLILNSGPVPS